MLLLETAGVSSLAWQTEFESSQLIFGILLLAIVTLGFCMIAKRLSSTVLTAPILFLALGVLIFKTGILSHREMEEVLHLVAEIALILLLFLDAAQTDLGALRARRVWPTRMLLIAMPLTVLLGTLAAWPFLDGWPIYAIILLACVLAPTDAALGQAVVANPAVPERSRRALTVESGLNDGLALPAILLFASLTAEDTQTGQAGWLVFGASQLLLGPLVGMVAGTLGGKIFLWAKEKEYTSEPYEGIGAIALAVTAYLGATAIGGNGFISAFVAGLCFGSIVGKRCKFVYEFTESEGQGLAWGAFFLIGLVLVPEAVLHLTWPVFAIICGSLLIVRPLAIWLSLLGTDASPPTRIFFGWFGPRGLATALFALIVVDKITGEFGEAILHIAVNTVWISALVHGLSAAPGARWYASIIGKMGDCAETGHAQHLPKSSNTMKI